MSKDITIVWRRYEDIEVGDIVGPQSNAEYDRVNYWYVVEAVRQIPDSVYVGNQAIELNIGIRPPLVAWPLNLIQVQVENFS